MKRTNLFTGSVLSVVLLSSPATLASDAIHCVSIGVGERSQSLTNICNHPIEVLWCHTRDEPGYQRSLCGSRGDYFQKQAVLLPQQVKQNQFSLPFNSTLFYAACPGNHGAVKAMDRDGNYLCQ